MLESNNHYDISVGYCRMVFCILLLVVSLLDIVGANGSQAVTKHYTPTLSVLDRVIDSCNVYDKRYSDNIDRLKQRYRSAVNDEERLSLSRDIFFMYKSFNLDSAYVYASLKQSLAMRMGATEDAMYSELDRALILIKSGDYMSVLGILNAMAKNPMSLGVRKYFYSLYAELYEAKRLTALTESQKRNYEKLRITYRDSLRNLQVDKSIWDRAEFLTTRSNYTDALRLLQSSYDTLAVEDRAMGYVAYSIADIYHSVNDREREKRFLIISAISDLKNSVKEYISLRRLALILYEEGDVEHAYRYMRKSLEDATFCKAKLRIFEVSDLLPIIDKSYDTLKASERSHIWQGLIVVTTLLVLLLLLTLYTRKQLHRIAQARRELMASNDSLASMNAKLSELNTQLNTTNNRLNNANVMLSDTNASLCEANKIKNIYIMEFMSKCSLYIEKIDTYRRSLNKLASAGDLKELCKRLKSKTVVDEEVEEFFEDFDHIFLKIFPNFVDSFNSLLRSGEAIVTKKTGRLNTELRIFALLRLGIDDNDKIASFLRCSKQTVYSYRSRIRLRSISPENFESMVLKIE